MRNSIIIIALAFAAIFSTNSANAAITLPTNPAFNAKMWSVTVTINIGRRSENCSGFGICSIKITADFSSANRPSNNSAVGTAEDRGGKLVLTLNKASMTREALAKYFVNNKFVVDEDFDVPAEITSPRDAASGLPTGRRQYTPLAIKKGVYNVQDNGTTLTIIF
jgi:hypothetical protein